MSIAELLYTTYCESVGGMAFNGDPLPDWETFKSDPSKKKQSDAWIITSSVVMKKLFDEYGFFHRLGEEYTQLADKMDKLRMFLGTEKFKSLEEVERNRLSRQYSVMAEYQSILSERILYHGVNKR